MHVILLLLDEQLLYKYLI